MINTDPPGKNQGMLTSLQHEMVQGMSKTHNAKARRNNKINNRRFMSLFNNLLKNNNMSSDEHSEYVSLRLSVRIGPNIHRYGYPKRKWMADEKVRGRRIQRKKDNKIDMGDWQDGGKPACFDIE